MTEHHWQRPALQVAFAATVVAAWHVIHLFTPRTLPSIVEVALAFRTQVTDDRLLAATGNALLAIFTGYALALAAGIVIGLLMGLNRGIERFLDPYVSALYATPFAALVPALIVWFGTGFQTRVAMVVLLAIFPVIVNTLEGVRATPAGLVDAARSFGAGRLFVIRKVILPHEVSYLMAGARLAIARAVTGLVVAELLIAVTGLGAILTHWSLALKMGGVFSVVGLLMFIGVALTAILRRIERRVAHWEVSRTT